MATKDNRVVNPSEGCNNYGVEAPQMEGAINEVSIFPLSTSYVDLCTAGWHNHLADDAGLRIKGGDNHLLREGEIDSTEDYKGYHVGETYVVDNTNDFLPKELKKKEFVISNTNVFEKKKKNGEPVCLEVEFILKDTVLGNQVVFKAYA